ncbi:fumarylacetoacetate hydrolase family protein [Actinocorallia sp. A-T 12471]|uniref:fumarylacetoacetate hydrolase family protein n=1 Tax=Actinocorallia sp. A-T 12471 TaxID=3089813 RepID=UPI0029D04F03|nr:fumarylacetoacetate hydrolase family protein [Actinocorallia sp. A-T 12471]MDX6740381.1 fumarylacetoacetate hydrolase family protein [Actinocorallia sp. A-T 12471]
MRLATVRTGDATKAVRVTDPGLVDLGFPDVKALLAAEDWQAKAAAEGPLVQADGYAPVIPDPGKVMCVGLNYRTHILEMGRDLPEHPTLFAKFTDALIGPEDVIQLAPESDAHDWEAELVVVVGRTVRRADDAQAAAAIAGFTVMNDVTMRDWQFRTREWLQGKTFEGTTPLGPVLVTPDELPGGVRPALEISCSVDGEEMQRANTGDLVFDPVALVRYLSTIMTLRPGDVIASGTPGGVGHARKPARYLQAGSKVVTEIEHIGRLENIAAYPEAS